MDSRAGRNSVSLRPLTAENWKECAALSVGDSQRGFLPENLYSIAEAQFYSEASSRAIYAYGEGIVGFVLYGRDVEGGSWKAYRLMVDRGFQDRGYGWEAMEAFVSELSDFRDCSEILVSYQKSNVVARNLYASLGFRERGCEGGKATAALEVGG